MEKIQELKELLDQAQDSIDTYVEMVSIAIENRYNIDGKTAMKAFADKTKEDIDSMTEDELNTALSITERTDIDISDWLAEVRAEETPQLSPNLTEEEINNLSPLDVKRAVAKSIVEDIHNIDNLEKDIDTIKADYRNEVKKLYDKMNSPEYIQSRKDRVDSLRKQAIEETDPDKKRELEKVVNMFDALDSLSFLFNRMDYKGEKDSIIQGFLNNERGQLILKKYAKKAKALHIDPYIFAHFMNIECKFLPEKYHPFNNLFLFHVERFIAYIDTYNERDVLFVKNTLVNMRKLMYHEFPTQEAENIFINVIIRFLDYFMDDVELFREKNESFIKYSPEEVQTNTESGDATDEEIIEDGEPVNTEDFKESEDKRPVKLIPDKDGKLCDEWEIATEVGRLACDEETDHIIKEIVSDEGFKLFCAGWPVIAPKVNPGVNALLIDHPDYENPINTGLSLDQVEALLSAIE